MKKSTFVQRSSLALALEPRMMFDGAAAATTAEVASDTNSAPVASTETVEADSGVTTREYSYTISDVSDLFSDSDGDTLTYTLTDNDTSDNLVATYDSESDTITISTTDGTTLDSSDIGEKTFTLTASDGTDSASLSISLDVVASSDPVADSSVTLETVGQGTDYSCTVTDLFTDADGDTLTYEVSGLPDGLSASYDSEANTLTISGSTDADLGDYTITITATDEAGTSVSTTRTITVFDPAPTLEANTSDGTTVVNAEGNITSGDSLDLFDNVNISLSDDGDTLDTLVITVATAGSEHSLVIDGTTIELTATSLAQTTATNGYTYEVSVVNGSAIITLYLSNGSDYSTATVASVIDAITYKVADTSALESESFTVTLTSLSDTGGDPLDDTVNDTVELNISATVTIDSSVNVAPTATSSNDLDLSETITGTNLDEVVEVFYSSDGNYVYALDSDGTLCVFSVDENGLLTEIQSLDGIDALPSGADMVLNESNSTLYVLTEVTNVSAYKSYSNIVTFTVAEDGTLTYSETLDISYSRKIGSKYYTSTATGTSISISDDGEQIYVGTKGSGVIVYNVDLEDSDEDGSTSDLTFSERFSSTAVSDYATITTVGDYVFVSAGSANMVQSIYITVYTRQEDGTLSYLDSYATDSISQEPDDLEITTSEDGSRVYLSVTVDGSTTIYAYDFDSSESENNLTALSSLTVSASVTDIQSSDDGSTLYVVSEGGTLYVYSVDDNGEMTLTDTVEGLENANSLSLSADGELLVGGGALYRVSTKLIGSHNDSFAFADDVTIADHNLDLLNDGKGNYGGASVTVQRESGADSSDTFSFTANDSYTLGSDGTSILDSDGNTVATFTNSGGTLVITFADGTTSAEANAILKQWNYSNSDATSTGDTVTLTVVVNDGELDSTTLEVAILFTAANSAPSMNTTPEDTENFDTAGEEVKLFTNTTINTNDVGQALSELVLSVGGLSDVSGAEYIVVDGINIALNESSSGTTDNGYSYTYTLSDDGTATLTITSSEGISTGDMENLIDDMAYGNTSESAMTGTRTFTLTSLTDNGGTDGGGVDTVALSITATVTVAVNNAPTVNVNSEEGSGVYYNDGSIDGFSGYVTEVEISDDGKTVIVLGSSSGSGKGDNTIYVYSRDTDTGELTLLQSFTSDDVSSIGYLGSSVISSDGQWVYISSYDGSETVSVMVFSRDTDTGELTYVSAVTEDINATKYGSALAAELVLYEDDDGVSSLYLVCGMTQQQSGTNNSSITTYSIGDDGALTEVSSYTGGSSESGVYIPSDLVISDDGTYAYVANISGESIGVFSRDTETGELTFVASIDVDDLSADGSDVYSKALRYMRDITISADGNYLYVASRYGITVLQVDGSSVSYVGFFEVGSDRVTSVTLSSDGTTLYVGANRSYSVYVCSLDTTTGEITDVETVSTGAWTANLAVSSDGSDIYVGNFYSKKGLYNISELPQAELNHDGSAAVIGDTISFSDKDVSDYNGFTVTLDLIDGGSDSDSYGFSDGNDLTYDSDAGTISYNGTVIATFSQSDGTLTITFTSSVTETVANLLVSQITYSGTSAAILSVTVSDGSKSSSSNLALVYPNEAPTTSGTGGAIDNTTTGHTYSYSISGVSGMFSDEDGDDLTYTVEGLPDGLTATYDSTTDTITISGTATESGDFTVSVTATDATGESASVGYTMTVVENSAPATTVTDFTTSAKSGYEYSYDMSALFTDADGDTITITVDSDSLPTGLSYDSTSKTISGTTSVTGSYEIVVTATDGAGGTTTITLSLTVAENTTPVASSETTMTEARVNGEYSYSLSGLFSDEDGDDLTYTVEGLPDTLSYDAETQTITGTPTSADSYTVTITCTDEVGETATITLTLSVAENNVPVATQESLTLNEATYGTAYEMILSSDLFTDADGDTLTWTVTGLPEGLTFDAETLTISGTTTATDSEVTISVSDGYGGTASYTTTLTVSTPPSVTATGTNTTNTIASGASSAESDVDLFEDVTVSQDAYNEDLTSLVLTVDTYGENYALVIDGDEITLTATSEASTTTANGYSYKVEIVDGKAVVTIDLTSSSANSADDVKTLIDTMAYRLTSSSVNRSTATVTLVSLSDSSDDATEVNISSTVTLRRNSGFHTDPSNETSGETFTSNDPIADRKSATDSSTSGSQSESSDSSGSSSSAQTNLDMSSSSSVTNAYYSLISQTTTSSKTSSETSTTVESVFDAETDLGDDVSTVEEIDGTWSYDAAGNRQILELPSFEHLGIDAEVVKYRIVWAETGEPAKGLRLDVNKWSLISAGFKNPGSGKVVLQVETATGQKVEIPVKLNDANASIKDAVDGDSASDENAPADDGHAMAKPSSISEETSLIATIPFGESVQADSSGKPALTMQLAQSLKQSVGMHTLLAPQSEAKDTPSEKKVA